jgi:phosphatidylethanolamine/phosphatidyl-N-methylethanolamine N-methyltransferase
MRPVECGTPSFFMAWLKAPLRVAAVAPSGHALASLITADISPSTGPVIELGPGTGSFTRALIARGVEQKDITLIECGADFAVILRAEFPAARTIVMDAAHLRRIQLPNGVKAGAVISGLPLLSMSPRKVIAILTGAFQKMHPRGAFYQFTYGPRCPVPARLLYRLDLEAERVGSAIANIPPATVYRIRRKIEA